MEELVSLITKEPSEDTDEKVKYKWVVKELGDFGLHILRCHSMFTAWLIDHIQVSEAVCDDCRYPNSACELLTSDVAQITSILAGEEGGEDGLITDIYAFMENDGPLNPLLASFFSKVMGLLIGRKSTKVRFFLNS